MTLTAGQLVAYLSVQGATEAAREVKDFQQGLTQAGTAAQNTGTKVDGVESSLKSSGAEAVKTGGKLRDTSGALVGAASSSSTLTTANLALDAATRKVAESTAKGVAAQASLTAAQARLTAAEERAIAVRAAGNATAAETATADAAVAAAKAAVVVASNRVAASTVNETLALQGQAAASTEAALATAAGAQANSDAADSAVSVADGAGDAKDSIKELGQDASVAGASILAAFGAAQVMFSNFDAQMSSTGAAVSDLADGDLQRLRQAALDAGAATFFSATEAAAGEEALLKAGVAVSDVVNGALNGALNLAASGNLDVADSAETAATAMTIFGLSGAQVPHVADVLAAAAGKAQGEVSDMSQALNQSALVANQAGLSFEDTAAAAALFAANGLIGSDAGTSFKTMLLALNPTSKQAAQLMEQLGISAYDQSHKFIGLSAYAQLLHDKLGPLPDDQRQMALSTIFGTDAIRAASIVMDAGSRGVDQWRDAVDDAGYAQEQAAAKMDNLKGDVEQLSGAFQTLVLDNSSGVNGFLRSIVQHVTDDVNAFGQLPPAVGQVGTAVGAGAGAMLLFGGAMTLVRGRLDNMAFAMMNVATRPGQQFTRSIGAASSSVSFLSKNLLGITAVVGIAAIGFDYWSQQQAKSKAATDSLAQSLDSATGAVTDSTEAIVHKALEDSHAAQAAQDLGISQQVATDAALGNAAALAQIRDGMKAANDEYYNTKDTSEDNINRLTALTANYEILDDAVEKQSGKVADARQQWQRANQALADSGQAAQETADKQNAASTALDGTTVSMRDQTDVATLLKNALDGVSGKDISAQQAQLGLNASMNGFTDAVKKNGASLTETRPVRDAAGHEFQVLTDGATSNQTALIGAVDQINKHAESVYAQTESIDLVNAALQTDTDQLRAAAQAAGLNAGEVQNLIDKYVATPREVSTAVYADTSQATANISTLKAYYQRLLDQPHTIHINYDIVTNFANGRDYFGNPVPKAHGGLIQGPGTGTSDEAGLYALSNREFVLTAAAVNKVGVPFLERLNAGADPMATVGAGGRSSHSAPLAGAGAAGAQLEQNFYLDHMDPREVAAYSAMRMRTAGIV